jgi:hypothetical protein
MEVTFNLCSIKQREKTLSEVVDSLSNQTIPCKINLYLNYPHSYNYAIPFEGDLGDTGKFHSISNGWNLFVDDDIIYPKDYAETLIQDSEYYGCPVGVHGAVIPKKHGMPIKNYFDNRVVYPFWISHTGSYVNVLGTGTLCFNSSIGFSKDFIEQPNMADSYFAVWAQLNKIPLFCVPRRNGWLKKLENEYTLWGTRQDGKKQTEVINRVKPWNIYRVKTT